VLKFNPFKSKTVWGAIGTAVAFVAQHGVHPATVVQAVGMVVAAVGMRDAVEPGV